MKPGRLLPQGHLLVAILAIGFAQGVARAQVADYLNELQSENVIEYNVSYYQIADDIHRVSSNPLVGLDVGYYSTSPVPVNLSVFIYRRNDLHIPTSADLLARLSYPSMPVGGYEYIHLGIPSPLTAPADLWIGFRFFDSTGSTGLLNYDPPTLGFSYNLALIDFNGDGQLDTYYTSENLITNYFLGTYSIPEPGTFCIAAFPLVGIVWSRKSRNGGDENDCQNDSRSRFLFFGLDARI